ncbi:glycoside hydrolase family 15 protein [Caldivirga maquilingensis]|uniref:Glycoside hydrolase 15-related n=1 Tax=Caldivirga maquilingensis (strain ATCC 700844 / DSM 13496 / JCM 10307 / IC-167) TaxID=397948 RepID=A8M9X8_CALMQ|nr:glycoside hydrolase family 15 protein [Caldivirga maquilingensis]ABW02449.1 glycoside hydrolase 15-related [Caldivirga maquilingensis IC-167]
MRLSGIVVVMVVLVVLIIGLGVVLTHVKSHGAVAGGLNLGNCTFPSIINPTLPYNTPPSASYLLLSNWVNMSALISTGFPIFGLSQSGGLVTMPTSLRWLLIKGIGLVNVSLYVENLGSIRNAYLTLNNSIVIKGTNGWVEFTMPPYTNAVLITQNSTVPLSYVIEAIGNYSYGPIKDGVVIIGEPNITVYSPGSSFSVSVMYKSIQVTVKASGFSYIELMINNHPDPPQYLLSINNEEVESWLMKSRKPNLSGCLLNEYYLSLLLIKDSQSPITGGFAASPEPIYLYTWVRDSSFAAMALQESGHYNSAAEYWLWMAKAQNNSGAWFTRYSFFNGNPDYGYGIPEYDSVGLFQIGVYQYYELTHNESFINEVIPAVNKSLNWEYRVINNTGLIPQDLSIWEDLYAYNFWTQGVDLDGLVASYRLYSELGYDASWILAMINELNNTIQHDFYLDGCYVRALEPSEVYYQGKTQITLVPTSVIYDSSVILPIDLGLLNPSSSRAVNAVDCVISNLWNSKVGGLARYTGDIYHYAAYLYDSSGEEPPWVITTLFLALYYEELGNYTASLNLMNWAINHTEYGLLPEAIDPNYGNPLPSTSPLVWSAAMYVITALNYNQTNVNHG